MRIGIIGGSGFVGGELLRLLLTHPKTEVTYVTSTRYAGEYVYRLHPNLRSITTLQFSEPKIASLMEKCDLVFTSVPHGTSIKYMPSLVETGLKIIDLSADYRLKDPASYVKWYGFEHPHPELLKKAVYGVPELYRDELKDSTLVASPGCMAVTSILALAPLVKSRMIDTQRIIVDAKIGSSGGGTTPSIGSHHSERYGVIRPYKPVGHRHTGEIEQELSRVLGEQVLVSMTPHAINMVRGILCTCHVFLKDKFSVADLWKTYRSFYQGEPFIRFVADKRGLQRYPDPKFLIGSNFCDIGFALDERASRAVILSASDNLVKGAAGSAVQCMNVMLKMDERLGLSGPPIHPA